MWAATKKHMGVVRVLTDHGAQLLRAKADGMTLLHVAASQNDIHMLDFAINKIKE